jgi:catechol 2,3-dioxygenase
MNRTAIGFRLPASTRVGAVALQVADLARSLAWYRDLLGARVLTRSDTTATLGAAGHEVPLLELHERAGAAPMPSRGRLGLFHVAWLLPDRAALGRFFGHAIACGEPLGSADHLVSEALYLQDPDGLGVEVYADRPSASWPMQGDEVQMASLPIDAPGLQHAASGAPWTGLPDGSRIGHVHLHVGDLARSTAFYRDVVGLGVTNTRYPGAVFLAAGRYHHHLGTNTWAGSSAVAAAEHDARLLWWELRVPDRATVDAVRDRARVLGGDGGAAVRDGLALADPWGTRVHIVTEPG